VCWACSVDVVVTVGVCFGHIAHIRGVHVRDTIEIGDAVGEVRRESLTCIARAPRHGADHTLAQYLKICRAVIGIAQQRVMPLAQGASVEAT
jgi:hypothetical protein